MALAVVRGAPIHFAIELVAGAGVFIRIRENSDVIETRVLHEPAEFLEIFRGFSRETRDKAGADRHIRYGAANTFQQLKENVSRAATLHPLQYTRTRML